MGKLTKGVASPVAIERVHDSDKLVDCLKEHRPEQQPLGDDVVPQPRQHLVGGMLQWGEICKHPLFLFGGVLE